ncbi:hypothetical protein M3J09_001697 [Ascochyta lentis]
MSRNSVIYRLYLIETNWNLHWRYEGRVRRLTSQPAPDAKDPEIRQSSPCEGYLEEHFNARNVKSVQNRFISTPGAPCRCRLHGYAGEEEIWGRCTNWQFQCRRCSRPI